jgi:DNA invertase Pin-like site-specific DNA recombinase
MLIGYARVSTDDQKAELQADSLKAAGCERTYTDDGVSGRLAGRPELDKCLDSLRPGDTLVVWKLDRLGRSVQNLVQVINDLAERQVGFQSLTEGIDTTTNGGKLVFHIFAALAEFERGLIRERTMAGLEAARARGRKGGRKPKLSGRQAATVRRMYDAKGPDGKRQHTVAEIAEAVGVHRTTVYDYLRKSA